MASKRQHEGKRQAPYNTVLRLHASRANASKAATHRHF